MVNELMISIKDSDSYLYFKTSKTTVKEAVKEFDLLMYRLGVNTDNLQIDVAVLRNKDDETIDKFTF